MVLFEFLGSIQILNLPFGFSTITIIFTQSVGSSIGTMILIFNICWSSLLTFSFNVIEILCGGLTVGGTLLSITI